MSNLTKRISDLSTEQIAILAKRLQEKVAATPQEEIARRARGGRSFPLSFAQQRLWFLDQLEPGSNLYNVPAAIRLEGPLNVAALRETFSEILKRHESLRTTFTPKDGQPCQVINENPLLMIPLVDLQTFSRSDAEAEARHLAAEEARQGFDLTIGPLLRVTLLRLAEQEHVLLVTMHHIVCDAWSMGVLIEEVSALYNAFLMGKPSPLAELPIQYADFSIWQRERLQGSVMKEHLEFWKRQLAGPRPRLMPTNSPPQPGQPYKSAHRSFRLSADLTASLKELSAHEGVTLFITLLAAFKALLYHHTGQEDVIVGTDIADRGDAQTKGLIGFFVNQLVMRTVVSSDLTFRALLARVRDVALGALSHKDLPFEKVVEGLRPERDPERTPLFQVKLALFDMPRAEIHLRNLRVSRLDSAMVVRLDRVDLALFIEVSADELIGGWSYNANLFDAFTISRMTSNLQSLLERIIVRPDVRLGGTGGILNEMEREEQAMQDRQRAESNIKKLKTIKRRPISATQPKLVDFVSLGPGERLPLVVQPASDEVDLIDWSRSNAETIEAKLLDHGAILFRGFSLDTVRDFEQLAQSLCKELFEGNGELPRAQISGRVYAPVDYPADKSILWHNENTFSPSWPLKLFFFCVQPAQQGGETPIVDSRKVYRALDPTISQRFLQKRIIYMRNYGDGVGLSWETVFQTTDKSEVENYCNRNSIEFEWKNDGRLRTQSVRPAVTKHPITGEMVWFNQATHWHVSCLEKEVRESLLALCREEDLPRNCYYGDGSRIEDSVMQEICGAYRELEVSFPWQKGNVLMLDNMLTAHARNPYVGTRRIAVALGEMITDKDLNP